MSLTWLRIESWRPPAGWSGFWTLIGWSSGGRLRDGYCWSGIEASLWFTGGARGLGDLRARPAGGILLEDAALRQAALVLENLER